MDKKLNNLLDFKDFGKFDMKVENKPGKKVVENLKHIQVYENYELDEGFFQDVRKEFFPNAEEKFQRAYDEIMSHPVRKKAYLKFKGEDEDKAKKYVEFFAKNPQGYPSWNEKTRQWVDTARYSHELSADFGAPSGGY